MRDGEATRSRGRGRLLRLVAVVLAVVTVALSGSPPPSPRLQTASATNPVPPTNVVAARADGGLVVSWTAPAEAFISGYRVFLDGDLAATPTATSATLTGLVNGRSYVVTVRTVTNFFGTHEGTTASTPVIGIPGDSVPPAAPTGVTAVRGDGQVTLSWVPNGSDADADGYRVLRDGVPVGGLLAGRGTSGWTDTGLVNDRTYVYTVQTRDESLNWSASSAPAVSATPTDLTPPAAPTGVVGGRGDGRAGLMWTANAEPDVVGYVVLRDAVEVATVPGTSHLDSGLVNDTTYTYTLVAVDGHGNRSAPSAPVAVTPTDLTPPAAPSGLTAVRGDGEVALSWTANTEPDLAGYVVLRDGVEVATVPGTTYLDTGLVNDTAYAYTLAAVDTHGNRSVSSSAVTATPHELHAPAPPTGLAAVRGDGEVTLSWTANPETDLAAYRVLRDGVVVATVTGTAHTDTALVNDRTYTYALVAVDTHDNASAPSDPVSATPTDLTPPAAPTGVTAVRGDGRVSLSWDANAEDDLAGYVVFRDGVEVATVAGTTHVDSGPAADAAQGYAVVAVDTHSNRSAASSAVPETPVDRTPPAEPTGLVATAGDGQVTLSWTANGEPDLAGYLVLRDGVEVASVPGGSYTDTGLVNDRRYRYEVVAVDTSANASPPSRTASARPTDLTPPAVPAGLAAARGDRQVTLSWTANGETDLAGYVLLRDGVEVARPTGTTYTDTGLTNDRTYTYALVAVDTHGNASPAATVSATPTDLTAPSAPTGVTATAGDGQAVLRWDAAPEADVAAHRVLAADGSTVVTAPAPATSATVPGLANGTTHSLTVVAVDAHGNVSARSAVVTVTPVATTVPAEGVGESGGVAASSDGRFVVVGTRARLEPADTNTAYELYLVDRAAGTRTRVAPLAAGATGAADPTNTSVPAVSDDGRFVVLATTTALDPRDTNRLADVYRLDVTTRTWTLVSAPQGGTASPSVAGTLLQTGGSVYATGPSVAVSADGDLVLFYSARSDLVAGDTNGVVDVFAKRVSDGTVTRVSTTATGGNLSGTATGPALALTPDGRFALFTFRSTSGLDLLYRKTLSGAGAGEALVVSSVTVSGRATQYSVFRDAGDVAVSDDGRYVALVTSARLGTATPAQTWTTGLAYRVDTATGAVLPLGSGQTTVWEHQVELDPTGRYAFFATAAAALPADGNGHTDHYRRDLDGGAVGPLVLVTADAAGRATAGPTGSVTPAEYGRLLAVSGDRVLVTTSQALTATDANRLRDLYTKDLVTGAVGVGLG